MAYKNKTITNSKTGQTIKFLQTAQDTGGNLLEMESTFRPYSKEPPLHCHPKQDEKFTVISGEITVRIGEDLQTFTAGDQFHVPKNAVHAMWNESSSPAVVNWRISPALETETFFENTIGLANDGKMNKKGMPNILQMALLANRYDNFFRLSKPPFLVQKILFSLLTPFAFMAGYRSTYTKYIN